MSADFLDASQEIEQALLDKRIAAIRAAGREFQPKGECHWCEERFDSGSQKIFCDADCSEDHAKYHRK